MKVCLKIKRIHIIAWGPSWLKSDNIFLSHWAEFEIFECCLLTECLRK